jgi:hypothetical protein
LTQYTSPPSLTQGDVRMSVAGLINGVQTELSHQELLGADKGALSFRFRHFQELAGSLTLPPGFVPMRLILKVAPRDAGKAPLERTYPWTELFS